MRRSLQVTRALPWPERSVVCTEVPEGWRHHNRRSSSRSGARALAAAGSSLRSLTSLPGSLGALGENHSHLPPPPTPGIMTLGICKLGFSPWFFSKVKNFDSTFCLPPAPRFSPQNFIEETIKWSSNPKAHPKGESLPRPYPHTNTQAPTAPGSLSRNIPGAGSSVPAQAAIIGQHSGCSKALLHGISRGTPPSSPGSVPTPPLLAARG